MKVLVTGANGLLGQHLVKLLLEKKYQVFATGKGGARISFDGYEGYAYHEMDITDGNAVHRVMSELKPDVVVHAAAMTKVEDCEFNTSQCERVNILGTVHVSLEADEFSKHFIYISTDFVFDGEKGNYSEEDDENPVNFYGFTKMRAEATVHASEIPYAIIRTCLVYGNVLQGTRSNIIAWVKENLEQEKHIRVVSDQFRTPTYVGDLAKGILLVIEKKAKGIFHISGKDTLTPYDMAIKTADYWGLDKSYIEKVDASTFTQPGKRPPKTGFNIEKAREKLGYEPLSFEEGLKKLFHR